jgi:hypothetical protein
MRRRLRLSTRIIAGVIAILLLAAAAIGYLLRLSGEKSIVEQIELGAMTILIASLIMLGIVVAVACICG